MSVEGGLRCHKIAGEGGTEADQLQYSGWSGLGMASVLSGWYGYNLFNVASFIEYAEPYPKRRKLDKTPVYQEQELTVGHRDSERRVKSHSVPYRPYISSELTRVEKKPTNSKKSSKSHESPSLRTRAKSEEEQERDGRTTIDNLFPEILCLVFEALDLQSKGRAAQVEPTSCSTLRFRCCFSLRLLLAFYSIFFICSWT